MAKKLRVHGFPVVYEENAYEGIKYLLQDLDYNEAKIFFDQARLKGSAMFEDDDERQFTLVYQKGEYTLVRR